MSQRKIIKTQQGIERVDGAGVKVNRVFAGHRATDFDPFLFLDVFDTTNPDDYIKGFPWHPHRGIETITYLMKGNIEHGDSIGNHGVISNGDCQWMTAGSGILHQEMPQAVEHMLGLQLWLNLPQKDKMTHPQYRDIFSNSIPTVTEENTCIHVISGDYKSIKGPVEGDYVKMTMLDVELEANTQWTLITDKEMTAFVYIFEGSGYFSADKEQLIDKHNAVLFDNNIELFVEAIEQNMRFMVMLAKPLHEPVVWGGSVVMNTEEEIEQARKELAEGIFIKHEAS